MFRKAMLACMAIVLLAGAARSVIAEGISVGGHLKLLGYDYKDGEMNGIKGHQYTGMALREMLLFVSAELTDKVSVDIQPQFDASTGATPKFGQKLQETKNDAGSVSPEFGGFIKAAVKVALPRGYELSAGIVKPRFTMEYGAELFWEDEFNGGKFAIDTSLGTMHETGIEVYKPFEFGAVSVPAYLYVINNSSEYIDNNSSPMVMIHAEPEIGAWKFTGSLGSGKYDNKNKENNTRYAVGAAYEWKSLSARAEYAGAIYERSVRDINPADNTVTIYDATPFGYYGKVFWRATPWARLMLHYDYVDHNFSGSKSTPGVEKYTTITPGVQFKVMSSSFIQVQYDIADWKQSTAQGDQTLKFNRLTVGWRTTF
ncbi:MAG: hypothetical protein ACYC9O_11915 [Candidatus Latescibacterota bacterium]